MSRHWRKVTSSLLLKITPPGWALPRVSVSLLMATFIEVGDAGRGVRHEDRLAQGHAGHADAVNELVDRKRGRNAAVFEGFETGPEGTFLRGHDLTPGIVASAWTDSDAL